VWGSGQKVETATDDSGPRTLLILPFKRIHRLQKYACTMIPIVDQVIALNK
jgi:hypothetical protein